MKSKNRYSAASGSERAKLRKLQQRGWRPGRGYIGDWLRSVKRQKKAFEVQLEN